MLKTDGSGPAGEAAALWGTGPGPHHFGGAP